MQCQVCTLKLLFGKTNVLKTSIFLSLKNLSQD